MRYLKTYEENKKKPEVGDYVLVTFKLFHRFPPIMFGNVDDRLKDEICKVVRKSDKFYYVVLPDYFGEYRIYPNEIIKILSRKEVNLYLSAKKYNL
jgi:hypothetical protein